MKFPIPHCYGSTHPENLDRLPEWLSVEIQPYNSLCDEMVSVTILKEPTFALCEELWELEQDSDHSLRNSNRRIAGEEILMCEHLNLVYQVARRGVVELLCGASYEVSGGQYKLTPVCLEESPSGKRFLHSLPSEKSVYAHAPFMEKGEDYTATQVADLLAPLAEARALEGDVELVRVPSYITG